MRSEIELLNRMKSKWPQYYKSSPKIEARAKSLRRESTPAESLLWKIIRNRSVKGFKFRRQHPIKHFIVDFYCHSAKLIIEIDGDIHEVDEIKIYDKEREGILQNLGLTVLRFTNEEVFSDPSRIINSVEKF